MNRVSIPVVPPVPLYGAVPYLVSSISTLIPRLGLLICILIALAIQYGRSPWRKVPPGPRGIPILGHALKLQDKTWLFRKDCKRKFGVSSFISVIISNMSLQVDKRYPRAHNVLECPRPTHPRHK
jgi:hypothetical protein